MQVTQSHLWRVCMALTSLKPQGHVQVLLNMLRGFTPQTALDAPRFCISAGIPDAESNNTGAAGDINSEVYFEDGISKETVETLRSRSQCIISSITMADRNVFRNGT